MPLYLDPQCSIQFPYTLPKKGCGRTHLIAVTPVRRLSPDSISREG